ncbi:hypothetical protein LBMAG07_12830 [Actinomycetes bacterium]|nr:hypothetical protein LBMAG07_12830 [Actinomycetes bacterium]
MVRHGQHWADDTWLNATLCCFVATLVLAATATPARIVSCGQDCGRLSGGWVIHAYKATGYIWQAKRPNNPYVI